MCLQFVLMTTKRTREMKNAKLTSEIVIIRQVQTLPLSPQDVLHLFCIVIIHGLQQVHDFSIDFSIFLICIAEYKQKFFDAQLSVCVA